MARTRVRKPAAGKCRPWMTRFQLSAGLAEDPHSNPSMSAMIDQECFKTTFASRTENAASTLSIRPGNRYIQMATLRSKLFFVGGSSCVTTAVYIQLRAKNQEARSNLCSMGCRRPEWQVHKQIGQVRRMCIPCTSSRTRPRIAKSRSEEEPNPRRPTRNDRTHLHNKHGQGMRKRTCLPE